MRNSHPIHVDYLPDPPAVVPVYRKVSVPKFAEDDCVKNVLAGSSHESWCSTRVDNVHKNTRGPLSVVLTDTEIR